jgi:opacity protein-like surface antigen
MKKLALNTLAAAALFASTVVTAQPLQMSAYLGASGGVSSWNADCSGTTNCKKNPGSFRIYGGYNFLPSLGLEMTLASLGTVKANVTGTAVNVQGAGMDIAAVYRFGSSSSPFGAFVKGTLKDSDTKNGFGFLAGVGATYALTDHFALRAELDTQRVKVPAGSSVNVTTFTVGGQGSF